MSTRNGDGLILFVEGRARQARTAIALILRDHAEGIIVKRWRCSFGKVFVEFLWQTGEGTYANAQKRGGENNRMPHVDLYLTVCARLQELEKPNQTLRRVRRGKAKYIDCIRH